MLMMTATGMEHGLVQSLPNNVPFDDFKAYEPSIREEMRKQKKEDSKQVKARFINHVEPGQPITKQYCRYAGDPLQKWVLIPGYEYTLPLGLVKEVNASSTVIREGLQSVDGKDINKSGAPLDKDKVVHNYELVPTKF